MSEIPPSWIEATLGDLRVTAQSGFPSGKHNAEGRGVPHLRPMNIDRLGNINLDEIKYVEDDRDRRLQPGDVLFNNTNSPALIGKTAYFDRPGDYAFSNHMTRLRTPEGVDPRFLALRLHTMWMEGLFQRLCSHHVNQASVSSARLLAEVAVELPPLNEQRRIAAVIEEQLSRLDAAEKSLQHAGVRMVALRTTTLAAAFGSAHQLRELVSVTDASRPICYGILKPKTTGELVVPYVEVRSIEGGRINLSSLHRTTQALHDAFRRSELRGGDVVLAIRGSWDRAAVVPEALDGANVSRDVARIAPLPHVLDPRYLAHFLSSPVAARFFHGAARGVGVRGVNIGDLRMMPVPIPALDEQHGVVVELEQRLSVIDSMRDGIEAARRRSAALRRSILERAFRGELVLQDPSDEPASALLERIRAERTASAPTAKRRKVRV